MSLEHPFFGLNSTETALHFENLENHLLSAAG